jgi:hypothetical protein
LGYDLPQAVSVDPVKVPLGLEFLAALGKLLVPAPKLPVRVLQLL